MNSRQINFYLTPEDFMEIEKYLKDHNLLLIGKPSPDKNLLFTESLLSEYSGSIQLRGHKYIIRKEDLDSIVLKYVEAQKHYVVDVMNSPVIEIWCSDIVNNEKKLDRIYYVKESLIKNPLTTHLKSPEFLKMADEFFKWFRKQFKNAKLQGYENDIVSPACALWVLSGGKLIKNVKPLPLLANAS